MRILARARYLNISLDDPVAVYQNGKKRFFISDADIQKHIREIAMAVYGAFELNRAF